MKVTLRPGRARGTVSAPPSKSYAHRLMICAALAEGQSLVRGIAPSQDMLATMDCLRALGACPRLNGDVLAVDGARPHFADGTVFPCRESGSTLRFFLPLALIGQESAVFTGSPRLIERGVSVYEALFEEKGISLTKTSQSIIVSGRLTPGDYVIPGNISSQFVSGLLFALPMQAGRSVLTVLPPVESRPYIDITLDVMRACGVTVRQEGENRFVIPGGQRYRPGTLTVEGDWSNSAAYLAFNAIGGNVTVTGLNEASLQGDRVCVSALAALSRPDPVIDLSDCPDLGPVLFAVAAAGHGARFTGTRRLRIKESDRASVMAAELQKFGVAAKVDENSVWIPDSALHAPTQALNSHNDHRIVMALALLCSLTGGTIDGAEAISKSLPHFFEALSSLGLEVYHET